MNEELRDMKRYFILLDIIFVSLYVGVMLVLYYMERVPASIRILDLILLGLAAARLTDIISTDEIMKWLREPFVRMEKTEIAGTEAETRTGRGRGWRKVLGDLLSCPWCVGVWVAAGLTYAYFLAPRIIWLFILILAVAEIASILQTIGTILVRLEKYFKGLGVPEEGL
jgi:hypothetical protein